MQAAVQDIQIGLLHVGRRYASRRGYLVEAVAGCGNAEVAIVLVHGELVQNMSRHSTRRLIANACTINTDPVHSSLFDLTPDWLSEEDLSRWSRVVLGYVDTNNRSEAMSHISDIRMID